MVLVFNMIKEIVVFLNNQYFISFFTKMNHQLVANTEITNTTKITNIVNFYIRL